MGALLQYRFAFIGCILYFTFFISACSLQKQISRSARHVLTDSSMQAAHVGISLYEPATGHYWYNYNGDKYFVPASNTKIPTCYAAMKYLGDSLVGLRYAITDTILYIQPAGDPTFLHPDFIHQPVHDFLRSQKNRTIGCFNPRPVSSFGNGWVWNDYNEAYMAERSSFPMYGNVVRFSKAQPPQDHTANDTPGLALHVVPEFFRKRVIMANTNGSVARGFSVERLQSSNLFILDPYGNNTLVTVPFTREPRLADSLLMDTLGVKISSMGDTRERFAHVVHSQPTDSLLAYMMHHSDNFFAEQALLMVSNERLGSMSDERIIDTLLATDFKALPQKPRWADASGLSRYNLFTPQDFIFILARMQNEFGMERIRLIFPTGGEGTIGNYYRADSGYIYAKTGTLSGVVAFSGFLYTRNDKLLVFSVLVNNHRSATADIRRAVEKFLHNVRQKY